MKTYQIPEEPEEGSRVVGESRVLYTNTGSWSGPWVGTDGTEYEWTELLIEDGPVRELIAPVDAIHRLKLAVGGRMFRDEDVLALIEFAEAFS